MVATLTGLEAGAGTIPMLARPDLGEGAPTLPVRAVDDRAGGPDRPPRWPILVVEDAPACGRLVQALLAKLGFEAHLVTNGYEAVAAIEQGSFDLVLMDLQMPELDGLDATLLIRSRWPDRTLPIYAVTGVSEAGVLSRCLCAGMDGLVAKPVNLAELAELLDQLRGPAAQD